MALSASTAAKTLGHYSGWGLSNLQMQKILYITHMFFMGRNNGARLINESFEAWNYGPVLPSLYQKIKVFGSNPVTDIFWSENLADAESPEAKIIKEACDSFSQTSAANLVAITHRAGGAWDKNYQPNVRGIKIPDTHIIEEYKSLDDSAPA